MPALTSLAYPNTLRTVRALMEQAPALAEVRLQPPPNWEGGHLITLAELPGRTNPDDDTYFALCLISAWGSSFDDATDLAGDVQVRVLSAGLTEAGGVLIDSTGLYTGATEGPEMYPDERRIDTIYQFAWRRQFRPVT